MKNLELLLLVLTGTMEALLRSSTKWNPHGSKCLSLPEGIVKDAH